ncbi:MAG: 16S rRNA (guanine(527)-N(7))-methyltransferase RsmG [Clostridia bacterium]|nr:16S rRNA (guanine(527)-N(7))-methyltransferase RsmG [Clostridia bacterium]
MTKAEFLCLFAQIFRQNGLDAYLDAGETLFALTERMLEVNEHLNLTAIVEPEAVILRHYADSLILAPMIPQGARVADIGSGAGFPALPLAIARPDLRLTAIDGTGKRVRYMTETAQLLGLSNFTALTLRAEDGGRDSTMRGKFDVATARAVAALPILSELCLPYVKVGGLFLAMKSREAEEELVSASRAIHTLGGGDVTLGTCTLTASCEPEPLTRTIISVRKLSPTPAQYPRDYGAIKKKSL